MAKVENANNLGAPAEGFGQNVTFAAPVGQVPSARDLGRAQPVQGGVEGVGNNQGMDHTIVAPRPPEDHAYAMLMDAAGEILGPKVKEARTEKFVQGMQRAAQGEAVKDIVDAQPWYSKIFGDSDAVAGARSYTGHAKAAEAAGALEDQMHELRKLEPADAQKVFSQTISKSLTGDATTDAQIMSTLVNQMPALMRRQAKENYAYKQDQASSSEATSMMSGAKALQAAAQGTVAEVQSGEDRAGNAIFYPGSTKPEEFAAQSDAFVKSIVPVQGRDLNNWQLNTTKTMVDMARGGLFHGLNAIEAKGGLDALTEDQKARVVKARDSEELRQRALGEAPYVQQIANIRAGMHGYATDGRTVNDYLKQMDDVNNAYTARTGSRLGIFTPEQRTALLTDGIEVIRKDRLAQIKATQTEAAKAATQAEKDAAKVTEVGQTVGQWAAGDDNPDASRDVKAEAWKNVWAKGKDAMPIAAAAYYGSAREVDPQTKHLMQGAVESSISSQNPAGLLKMYTERWLPMYTKGKDGGTDGAAMADAYMGDDLGKKMRIFHDMIQQGPEFVPNAFAHAFVLPTKTIPVGNSSKEDKALRSDVFNVLKHSSLGISSEWWGTSEDHGGVDLRPDQTALVASLVKKNYHDVRTDEGDPKAATIALHRLQKDGFTTLGGFAWMDPSGAKPVVAALSNGVNSIPSNKVAPAMRDALAEKIKAIGMDPGDNVSLMRSPDSVDGDPRFTALVTNKDAEQHFVTLTGSDIRGHYHVSAAKASIASDPKRQINETLYKSLQQAREQANAARNNGTIQE